MAERGITLNKDNLPVGPSKATGICLYFAQPYTRYPLQTKSQRLDRIIVVSETFPSGKPLYCMPNELMRSYRMLYTNYSWVNSWYT